MNYPQRNKTKRNFSPGMVFVGGLFIFLLFVQYFFGTGIKELFVMAYKPVWAVKEVVLKPISGIDGYFSSKISLVNENRVLRDQLTKLQLKEYDYDLLQKENDDLKSQLGRSDKNKKIIANIIAKPPTSPYDTFIIDAGAEDGVTTGSKAYLSEKIIAGEVTEVRKNSSVVSLFSTANKNTQVTLERTGAGYNLVGQGGQNYRLEAPKDTDIVWGDVLTYPDGERSIVGQVYYIDTNSQSAFKTAYIKPPVNIFSYKTVLIEEAQ